MHPRPRARDRQFWRVSDRHVGTAGAFTEHVEGAKEVRAASGTRHVREPDRRVYGQDVLIAATTRSATSIKWSATSTR
jgi:hypothetical protein